MHDNNEIASYPVLSVQKWRHKTIHTHVKVPKCLRENIRLYKFLSSAIIKLL